MSTIAIESIHMLTLRRLRDSSSCTSSSVEKLACAEPRQTLDHIIGAVDVKQTTEHSRQARGVDLVEESTELSELNHETTLAV